MKQLLCILLLLILVACASSHSYRVGSNVYRYPQLICYPDGVIIPEFIKTVTVQTPDAGEYTYHWFKFSIKVVTVINGGVYRVNSVQIKITPLMSDWQQIDSRIVIVKRDIPLRNLNSPVPLIIEAKANVTLWNNQKINLYSKSCYKIRLLQKNIAKNQN